MRKGVAGHVAIRFNGTPAVTKDGRRGRAERAPLRRAGLAEPGTSHFFPASAVTRARAFREEEAPGESPPGLSGGFHEGNSESGQVLRRTHPS